MYGVAGNNIPMLLIKSIVLGLGLGFTNQITYVDNSSISVSLRWTEWLKTKLLITEEPTSVQHVK